MRMSELMEAVRRVLDGIQRAPEDAWRGLGVPEEVRRVPEEVRRVPEEVRRVMGAVADVLMPRQCVVCGERLEAEEEFLCGECLEDFPLTRNWNMEFNPMADRFNEMIQHKYDVGSEGGGLVYEPYSRAAGLFFYNAANGYPHICHELKYRGNVRLGRYFARELGRRLGESPLFADVDTVVPVPLHWRRRWERGYNQAEVIAREIALCLGAELRTDLLTRSRNTGTQTVLDNRQKILNVAEAFIVRPPSTHFQEGKNSGVRLSEGKNSSPHFPEGDGHSPHFPTGDGHSPHFPEGEGGIRHILLVDDVFTTGATAAACHLALRRVFGRETRISMAALGVVNPD